jgi:hypothetical protein
VRSNAAVSVCISKYIASNDKEINNELERMWKEVVVAKL